MNEAKTEKLRIGVEDLFRAQEVWPVVVIEHGSGRVISLSQVNEAALRKTLAEGTCHYWDDVNETVYLKGEHSNEVETLREMRLDICHARRHVRSLLFRVDLAPGRCKFGASCCHFYRWDGEALSLDESCIVDAEACREHWTRVNTLLDAAADREHMRRYAKKET